MKLKAYPHDTRELKCYVVRNRTDIHFCSDRALGPGEPNFHACDDDPRRGYLRIEASTNRSLRVPAIPTEMVGKLSWIPIQEVKIAMTTYSKMMTMPDEWEIDDLIENGDIFLGAATDDGKSDGGTCILAEEKKE